MISRAELSRLARERLFFEANSIQYKNLVEKSKRVNADTIDNLMKMSLHINKLVEADKLRAAYIEQTGVTSDVFDLEEGTIEERIPENRARDLLFEWKKILFEYKQNGGDVEALFASQGSGAGESLLMEAGSAELEKLKDKLFISTGEDQLDTWEAFAFYKLDPQLTSDDNNLMMRRQQAQSPSK